MDRKVFFAALRKRDSGVFGTSLSQGQVDGVNAIVDASKNAGFDIGQAAYSLATGYGETGGKMQPVRENMNYRSSQIAKHFGAHRRQGKTPQQLARNPKLLANTVYGGEWGKKHLGNVEPNDGWNFRGWGIGQFTGRRNTEKASRDVGMDLVSNPALLDSIEVNAKLMVQWLKNGRATGKRLAEFVSGNKRNYLGARSVWGGVDAHKYFGFAKSFEKALTEADYAPAKPATAKPLQPPKADPAPDPQEQPQGVLAALISAFLSFIGGKR